MSIETFKLSLSPECIVLHRKLQTTYNAKIKPLLGHIKIRSNSCVSIEVELDHSSIQQLLKQACGLFHKTLTASKNGYEGYASDQLKNWLRPWGCGSKVLQEFESSELGELISDRLPYFLEHAKLDMPPDPNLYFITMNQLMRRLLDAFLHDGIDEGVYSSLAHEYCELCDVVSINLAVKP